MSGAGLWEKRYMTSKMFDKKLAEVILWNYRSGSFTVKTLYKLMVKTEWNKGNFSVNDSENYLKQKVRRSLQYMEKAGLLRISSSLKSGKQMNYEVVDIHDFAKNNYLVYTEITKMTYMFKGYRMIFYDTSNNISPDIDLFYNIISCIQNIGPTFGRFTIDDLKKIWPEKKGEFPERSIEFVINSLAKGNVLKKFKNKSFAHTKSYFQLEYIIIHILNQFGKVKTLTVESELLILELIAKLGSPFTLLDLYNIKDPLILITGIFFTLNHLASAKIISIQASSEEMDCNFKINVKDINAIQTKITNLKEKLAMNGHKEAEQGLTKEQSILIDKYILRHTNFTFEDMKLSLEHNSVFYTDQYLKYKLGDYLSSNIFTLIDNKFMLVKKEDSISSNEVDQKEEDPTLPPEFTDEQIGRGVITMINNFQLEIKKAEVALKESNDANNHLSNEFNSLTERYNDLIEENDSLKKEIESFKSANESIILASRDLENQIVDLKQELSNAKEMSKKDSGQMTMRIRPLD